jgi:GNAT superfamily N-acetyltransferase
MTAPPAAPPLDIRPFAPGDREAVKALWRACNLTIAANDPDADIDFCCNSRHGTLFVGVRGSEIVATAMAGHDGHRGWLYYVAAADQERRHGVGRRMVAHAEAWLESRRVPKVNLMIRMHNDVVQGFYEKLGYATEPRVVMGKRFAAAERDMLTVVITYLETKARPIALPVPRPAQKLAVLRAENASVAFYRYLYNTIGKPWLWHERRRLGDEALLGIIRDPKVDIYVLYVDGEPAGFAELDRRQEPEIELAYFGLMPHFIGRGLGPFFLRTTIETAWRHNPQRFWVHTCNFDHPKAIAHYQRAGFVPYRQETLSIDDPRPLD